MQKFDYRVPRFSADVPARLTLAESTRSGQCKDISLEGMRLEMQHPFPLDSVGTLELSVEGIAVELGFRITNCQHRSNGLKFIYESEEQRQRIRRIVSLLASPHNKPGLVLLS